MNFALRDFLENGFRGRWAQAAMVAAIWIVLGPTMPGGRWRIHR